MAEDIERLLRSTQGERPSPEFVANLRERIIEEALAKIVVPATDIGDIGGAPHEQRAAPGQRQRWMSIGLAVAAALVLIVGAVGLAENGDQDRLKTVAPTRESVVPAPAAPTATAVEGPARSADGNGPAAQLTGVSTFVEEGAYRIDDLGTSFEFTTDTPLWVGEDDSGAFTLVDTDSIRRDDRGLLIMRLSALSDPAQPTTQFASVNDGWSTDDFAGWLDALPGDIVVSDRQATTVGGRDAMRADLDLSDMRCGQGSRCAYFGTNQLVYTKDLQSGYSYRIWVVDQGTQAPFAFVAGIADQGELSWFDFVDYLVATITFGEIAPNPIVVLPRGRAALPVFGGVSVELERETVFFADGRGFDRIPLDDEPVGTDFLANPLSRSGDPIGSTDALIEHLQLWNVQASELVPSTVGGLEARVFDITNESSRAELKLSADGPVGWTPPLVGRLWSVEHPELGLLIVSAGEYQTAGDRLPEVLAEAAALVQSLEFTGTE